MIELFKHQTEGAAKIADAKRLYLADPPGMGKTHTIIASLKRLGVERPLIACPAIVTSQWYRSMDEQDYTPFADPIVMSYDKLVRGDMKLMAELILKEKIDALIPDEAHYLKHASSQRTRLIMGKDGYARRVPIVIPASGTPMPKNPQELFTQLTYLAPEVLKEFGVQTLDKWTKKFCTMRGRMIRGKWEEKCIDVSNALELKALLDRVMLRRESGVDLPKIWWQTLYLNGENSDWQNWELGEDAEAFGKIAAAVREGDLESIANDPHVARMRRRLGELKVDPVVEMLRGQLADSTDKIAVFAYHTSVLHGLRDGLRQFGVAYIDGSVSSGRRDSEKYRFIQDEKTRVFIGQMGATGTGFDGLQYATNRAVIVEPDWTAENNVQIARRIARTGQTRGTSMVQMIALANTLDEAIIGINRRETEMRMKVFDSREVA